ncbi:MAG: zinc-ribbon domain containing protein [Verrucomicrobiota bacterium]
MGKFRDRNLDKAEQLEIDRRLKRLVEVGWFEKINGVPQGCYPVDPDKVSQNFGGLIRQAFYTDLEFDCCDCGVRSIWKASDQRWYFEESENKSNIYGRPKRCRPCRLKEKGRKDDARLRAGQQIK